MPSEELDLAGHVDGSQRDRKPGKNGWPLEGEASHYDADARELRLHHTVADKDAAVRAYLPDVLDTLKCHQDVQITNDEAALRVYVAKYVPKFSDSASDERLNDHQEPNTVATTVLMRYKPMEPEMILQLFGARFRQWYATSEHGGKRYFQEPWPSKKPKPVEVVQHEEAEWARGMPLLDFLRKSNCEGNIAGWLRRLHAKHEKDSKDTQPLEKFVHDFEVKGEVFVVADMLSRQWLVLHVPFDDMDELLDEVVLQRVPEEHVNFALAIFFQAPERDASLGKRGGHCGGAETRDAHTAPLRNADAHDPLHEDLGGRLHEWQARRAVGRSPTRAASRNGRCRFCSLRARSTEVER